MSTSFACVHSTGYARFLYVVMYLFWCLCELDGRINAFLILYVHQTLRNCDAIDENYWYSLGVVKYRILSVAIQSQDKNLFKTCITNVDCKRGYVFVVSLSCRKQQFSPQSFRYVKGFSILAGKGGMQSIPPYRIHMDMLSTGIPILAEKGGMKSILSYGSCGIV